MARKTVEYGFMAADADPVTAELKRHPFPGCVLTYRFPSYGIRVFSPTALPTDTRECLPGHALKQVLGDTGAGKDESEFFAALTKRWDTLAAGKWAARGEGEGAPRMTEKAAAIRVYARMKGLFLPGSTEENELLDIASATAIYEGKLADPLGVTWDAARRKAFLGKFATQIAGERGRTAEQEF